MLESEAINEVVVTARHKTSLRRLVLTQIPATGLTTFVHHVTALVLVWASFELYLVLRLSVSTVLCPFLLILLAIYCCAYERTLLQTDLLQWCTVASLASQLDRSVVLQDPMLYSLDTLDW